ncbi:MAG: 4a-hydroxytetrahydrobiopterin dehydratase [Phycisphaerales bacterium]|nr:4a-hydroxytetrahydrobiopterin dehydratase [Phycisphaerales bacterium]
MKCLADDEIAQQLQVFPEWARIGDDIQRTFKFSSFDAAIRFVDAIALHAESVQHHPDILIRYSKVTLTLSTHDAGGLTTSDFDLAREADRLATI